LKNELNALKDEALTAIQTSTDTKILEDLRIKYLGKKGSLTGILKGISSLSDTDKPIIGQLSNTIKKSISEAIEIKNHDLASQNINNRLVSEKIDITLPGIRSQKGTIHPIRSTLNEVEDIFMEIGYSIAEGPEIESDYYNFEALNIPENHPARDMHDTFYLTDGRLLRTHTSPVQIRLMENTKPPISAIMPGRVYRRDSDATHSPVFHQVEGLLVDTDITFADLKGTLEYFLHQYFGPERKVRFRPSYFPFTEPSAEVDVECFLCLGKGCRICKQTGWIEILGCGMVDPNVLKTVKIDPKKYTGFAFGLGVERIAMLKYGIDNIRLLYESDIRFLKQF